MNSNTVVTKTWKCDDKFHQGLWDKQSAPKHRLCVKVTITDGEYDNAYLYDDFGMASILGRIPPQSLREIADFIEHAEKGRL